MAFLSKADEKDSSPLFQAPALPVTLQRVVGV